MHPIFSLCHMHCDGQEGQEARLCHVIHPSDQSRVRLDHQIARFCLKFVIPCYGYALFHIVFRFSSPAAALPPALGVSDVFPPGKPCTVGWNMSWPSWAACTTATGWPSASTRCPGGESCWTPSRMLLRSWDNQTPGCGYNISTWNMIEPSFHPSMCNWL